MYNSKVLEIFRNPQNYGRIANADAVGKAGEVEDGDIIKLFVRLKGETIEEAGFETFGCVAAIVSSAVVTDLLKGKTLEQALKLKTEDIVKVVDEFPHGKEHGAELAVKAVEDLVLNYRKRLVKEGKLSEEEFKKLTSNEKVKVKAPKAKASKKDKKVKKQPKRVAKEENKVEEKKEEAKVEQPKKEMHSASKLMLLTKKITTTTKTKNAAK
ncbi:MAG: iron-sulfur cluster assembly scaffold protein [Clostridia bacterium]|nr:iron-sulfur cluster assembly scaffold protein [Clostridia bacterium]